MQNSKTQLEILLQDYAMARDDERSYLNVLAAMFGVVLTLLGLLVAVASSACDFRVEQTQCFAIARPALAALPLLPLATMAYIQIATSLATLRSYYIRGVEREIRAIAGSPIAALPGVMSSSYIDFIQTLVSLRRGRKGLRISGLIILSSIIIIFGGFTFLIATKLTVPYQIAMALVYVPLVIILFIETVHATVGGRSLFIKVLRQYLAEPAETGFVDLARTSGRGVGSYLVFPRPEDWHKWLFLPLAFAFGLLCNAQSPDFSVVVQLIFAVVVVEYLIYQGRYQWNDIRGLEEDLVHPEAEARKRLPAPRAGTQDTVEASVWVIAVRQIIATIVIMGLFFTGRDELGEVLAAAMVIIWISAFGYEKLRTKASTTAPTKMSQTSLILVILVGCGYAVRAFVGLGVAGIPLLERPVAWVLVMATWAFGVMFVSITWALEGLAHVSKSNGRYHYAIGERAKREGIPLLGQKPHLGAMLSFLKIDVRSSVHLTKANVNLCNNLKQFVDSSGAITAPWNLGLIVSSTFGFLFILMFSHLPLPIGLVGLVTTLTASFAATRVSMKVVFWPIFGLATVILSIISIPAGVLWGAISLMYALFRKSSYHSLKHPFEDIAKIVDRFRSRAFTLFIGTRTATLLAASKNHQ